MDENEARVVVSHWANVTDSEVTLEKLRVAVRVLLRLDSELLRHRIVRGHMLRWLRGDFIAET